MYVAAQPHQECQQSRLVCLTHRLESGGKSVEQLLPDCAVPWQSSALELLLCTMPWHHSYYGLQIIPAPCAAKAMAEGLEQG